ncbi:Endonuclease/exonuclease/phosphatase, partial [Flammula alnicola]
MKKAAIKVASLNIRGYGNRSAHSPQNKWNHLNQVIRDNKIAILAVQETHMDGTRCAEIENLFGKRMKVHCTANEENPTGKGGVAIVINRQLLNANQSRATVIVPGRALAVRLKWHGDKVLRVLAIYAPNNPQQNRDFWKQIRTYYEQLGIQHPNTQKPDIMLGDFNMVEDEIDRLPMHADLEETVNELDELKSELGLRDGWRDTFPTTKSYTFLQTNQTHSQSRIDRIYTTNTILRTAREWKIETSGITNADHRMVTVKIVDENSPDTGKGRWSIPAHLLKDKPLQDYIQERGKKAETDIQDLEKRPDRCPNHNPQTIYAKFKRDIMDMARKRDRAIVPKITQAIRNYEKDLEQVNNDEERTEAEKAEESSKITEKIAELQRKKHAKKRIDVAVRNRIEGETVSKYWTQINKEVKPRDMIYALAKPNANPNEDPYEKQSQKMAELARNYHAELQGVGAEVEPQVRDENTRKVLQAIKARTTEEQRKILSAKVTEAEVEQALKKTHNGKAAGIDGITYELWKSIDSKYQKSKDTETPAFNLIKLITSVFNDIEANGVVPSTRFSEGWMCPLYKKNDRNDIANYCPLTMLNTDYKVFTKVLATKL